MESAVAGLEKHEDQFSRRVVVDRHARGVLTAGFFDLFLCKASEGMVYGGTDVGDAACSSISIPKPRRRGR